MLDEVNLLVVIASHAETNEEILADATKNYINQQLEAFTASMMCVTFGLAVYYVFSNLAVVKFDVINPISELTHHIDCP